MSKTETITKVCFKCGQSKTLSEFYRHPQMQDGHLGKCKECTCKDVRMNRAARLAYYHHYDYKRSQTTKRKRQNAASLQRQRRHSPERFKAYNAVNNAIRDGRLMRQKCEICGADNAQAHHDDHNKPFSIRWLCFKHHREVAHGHTVTSTF